MELLWPDFLAKHSLKGLWLDYSSILMEAPDGDQRWLRGQILSSLRTQESLSLRVKVHHRRIFGTWRPASSVVDLVFSFEDSQHVEVSDSSQFSWQTKIGEMCWASSMPDHLNHDFRQLESGRRVADILGERWSKNTTAD